METIPTLFEQFSPSAPFRGFEELVNKFMKPWGFSPALMQRAFPVDIVEVADKYIVKADLPGIERKAIDISFENHTLFIQVEAASEEVKKEEDYVLRERLCGKSVRHLALPLADNKGVIDAVLKDGVLKIVVPKSAEKQTKRIEIH